MDRGISPPLAPGAENLGHGLADINTLADLVKCTVHVTDRAHWASITAVHFGTIKGDPPHRVPCIVSGLGAPDGLVDIGATAYLDADA